MKSLQSRKNKILEDAARDTFLKDVCKNVCPNKSYHEDLFQEFLIVLTEKDAKFLIELAKKKNEFKGYCIRTLQVMAQSSRSNFNKHVAVNMMSIDGVHGAANLIKKLSEKNHDRTQMIHAISAHINTRQDLSSEEWFKRKVMQLYIKLGSGAAVAEATGILQKTINTIIKEKKEAIIKSVK